MTVRAMGGGRAIRCAGTMLALGALLGAAMAGPVATAHGADGHPAKIHQGTCDDYGAVAFPLNGVGAEVDLNGTPIPEVKAVNADGSQPVMYSETEIATTLDDLLAAPRALVVYASDEDLSAIACGNLGGARIGDELAVGIGGAEAAGLSGIALFAQAGDQTDVKIYFGPAQAPAGGQGGAAHDDAHDEATPAAGTAASGA